MTHPAQPAAVSFSAGDSASRDPRGGSLDPAVDSRQTMVEALAEPHPVAEANWMLGDNPVMRRIARSIERAAEVECTVLLTGETGTGKEMWARLLHRHGPRSDKAFVPVNCAALTPSLAESQLFGHEAGAFTGAKGRALGILRAARGGVVFFDEIGEMPLELQAKLLRVLQQREVLPIGAEQPVAIDVQVVAATNRDLEKEVEQGRFREDLYYRLNMIELRVPALRERIEDIPAFIDFFSLRCAAKYRLPVWRPDAASLAKFCAFPWPGNVRQLEHVIEQAYVLQIEPQLPSRPASMRDEAAGLPCLDLATLRERAIRQALEATRGHKARAAKLLGVHANTMTRLLKDLGKDSDKDLGKDSDRSLQPSKADEA